MRVAADERFHVPVREVHDRIGGKQSVDGFAEAVQFAG